MQSLRSIITGQASSAKRPTDKYLTRDFQALGLRLAEQLGDMSHKSLYIKLAKTNDPKILEEALSFVTDSTARNKGALFMWKLKKIKERNKASKPVTQ